MGVVLENKVKNHLGTCKPFADMVFQSYLTESHVVGVVADGVDAHAMGDV